MTSGKPAGKIIIFVLVATVVLCAAGLGLFLLISNQHKHDLRDDIISECPFAIDEDADWKMYPNDNQAGLIAAVSEHDGQVDRMILVLDKSADDNSLTEVIRNIVLWNSLFQISCTDGNGNSNDLEEKNVYETDNYIYLRAQYDSSATLTKIKIGTGVSDSMDDGNGEGVEFDFTEPFKVTYYIYRGSVIIMSQEYDEEDSSWSNVTYYEGERLAYD